MYLNVCSPVNKKYLLIVSNFKVRQLGKVNTSVPKNEYNFLIFNNFKIIEKINEQYEFKKKNICTYKFKI